MEPASYAGAGVDVQISFAGVAGGSVRASISNVSINGVSASPSAFSSDSETARFFRVPSCAASAVSGSVSFDWQSASGAASTRPYLEVSLGLASVRRQTIGSRTRAQG